MGKVEEEQQSSFINKGKIGGFLVRWRKGHWLVICVVGLVKMKVYTIMCASLKLSLVDSLRKFPLPKINSTSLKFPCYIYKL